MYQTGSSETMISSQDSLEVSHPFTTDLAVFKPGLLPIKVHNQKRWIDFHQQSSVKLFSPSLKPFKLGYILQTNHETRTSQVYLIDI